MSTSTIEGPRIRAGWSSRILARLDDLPASVRQRVRAAIPETSVAAIESASNLGWVPMQDHVGLLTGLVATLGEEDARHFLREVSKANLQGSLLKGALMSALRMFGVKPLALLRMFPRAYGTITRDCGEVSLGPTQAHDGTQACFDALPPVLRVRPFAVSLAAVFEAAFEVARRPGDVAIDDTALTEGRVRYVLRAWDRSGFDEQ